MAARGAPERDATEPLAVFGRGSVVSGLTLFLVGALFLFALAPGLDRWASMLFFLAADCAEGAPAARVCGGFPASADPTLIAVRNFFHVLPATLAVALLAIVLVRMVRPPRLRDPFNLTALVALGSLIASSAVLVNLLLKEFSGRPRPRDTELFGGTQPFVPVGEFTDLCARNCSFVSGEASAAFWLPCLVPLFPARLRGAALVVTLAVAVFVSMLRVAFGGHYLSDVTIAGGLTLWVFALASLATRKLMASGAPAAAGRRP